MGGFTRILAGDAALNDIKIYNKWAVLFVQLTWFKTYLPKNKKINFPKMLNGCFTSAQNNSSAIETSMLELTLHARF